MKIELVEVLLKSENSRTQVYSKLKRIEMAYEAEKEVWTIGHSSLNIDVFIEMLVAFNIELVVDIRRFPSSKKHPQFNQETLKDSLNKINIEYKYLEDLGGRRKVNPNSKNIAWRNPSFRAYADYMETIEFKYAFDKLKQLTMEKTTVYLCSEAVWWRCHRSMVSDLLKVNGWKVWHIMNSHKQVEHPYTKAASIKEGILRYDIKSIAEE